MRELDDKRVGLLVRMLGLRAIVCSKSQIQPLLTRRFVEQTNKSTYELTPLGRKHAMTVVQDACDGKRAKMIETYQIISIGSIVGMVQSEKRQSKSSLARRA
jgi:hypothetical protein